MKFKNLYKILILILLIASNSFIEIQAQSLKHQRWRMLFSVGASNFMGDLGGGVSEASHFFGYKDIDFKSTRYAYRFGLEYKVVRGLSFMQEFTLTRLYGNDIYSENLYRQNRNLHFKSTIWQTSLQMRYYFIREKEIARHTFRGFGGFQNLSAFVILGGGIFYYNPIAEYEGEWYNLRDFGTEGQGLNDTKIYKKYAFSMPVGMGFKYILDRDFTIGMELVNYYTNTDYIDDVHGDYYSNSEIQASYGDIAAALADQRIDNTIGSKENFENKRGGDGYNDSFLLLLVNITYHIRN